MLEKDTTRFALLRILFSKYAGYKNNPLPTPDVVKAEKEKYFNEANVVGTWFYNNLKKTDKITDKISINDCLFPAFKTGGQRKSNLQFVKELIGLCGERDGGNKGNSRGVFKNGSKYLLQGYGWISPEEEEEEHETNANYA